MARKVKELGQVYTPSHIVSDVLDAAGYVGTNINKKHIMENSCGPGAFLVEIVTRYIESFLSSNNDLNLLKNELESYIHAIDIDSNNITSTRKKLDDIASKYDLNEINWDLNVADTLTVKKYNDSMDYVVGNPPYVRVHNLDTSYDLVKEFSFAQDGMTDIYIVFFEIGLNMLKKGGILSYITASSYYNSLAGTALRKYIQKTKSVYRIMDLGHYNPFEETTYTTITSFRKNTSFDVMEYYSYNSDSGKPVFVDTIPYTELFVNDCIVLMEGEKSRKDFANIYAIDRSKHHEVMVKNGFATLADKIFISSDFNEGENIIPIYKGSTGEWKKCIYPYDEDGNLIPFEKLTDDVRTHLLNHKDDLVLRSMNDQSEWYSFGRTQAINDVYKTKIAVNILVKDEKSIKIEELKPGVGIYSGLYILSNYSKDDIESVLRSEDFVKYVRAIKKYKNGGYFTFSTDDLNKYLLYRLCNVRNKQSSLLSFNNIECNVQPCQ